MKPNTSSISTSTGLEELSRARSANFLPAIIGGSVAPFAGQSEIGCTTLWDQQRLRLRTWDDDAHGGVWCTTDVVFGSHKGADDLSESALSRIISYIVLSYMGDQAVKEAATTLVEIQQHYREVEAAAKAPKKLPLRSVVANVKDPKRAKVFEVD